MSHSHSILSISALLVSTAALVAALGRAPGAAAPAGADLAAVTAEIADLHRAQLQLYDAIERLESTARAARVPPRVAVAVAPAAVEAAAEPAAHAAAPPPTPVAEPGDVAAAVDTLLRLGPRSAAARALWKQLAEAGGIAAVVAAFEARVAADPGDPTAHVELGQVYLEQLVAGVADAPGDLASRAIDAFDRALELDPRHWEARFAKGRSLSFWPAGYGRMGEAIAELETLMAQQEGGPQLAQHADTYLWLGNLHAQQGRVEQARAIWQRGSSYHPDSTDLAERLASYARR